MHLSQHREKFVLISLHILPLLKIKISAKNGQDDLISSSPVLVTQLVLVPFGDFLIFVIEMVEVNISSKYYRKHFSFFLS